MDIKQELEKIFEHEKEVKALKAYEISHASQRGAHERKIQEIKARLLKYYMETGVKTDSVDMEIVNFTISVSDGRETLDVLDVDAVPEAFIKITKTLDRTLLNETYKDKPLPNWLTKKRGAPYLTIKAVMK